MFTYEELALKIKELSTEQLESPVVVDFHGELIYVTEAYMKETYHPALGRLPPDEKLYHYNTFHQLITKGFTDEERALPVVFLDGNETFNISTLIVEENPILRIDK